jgi:outer membrane immunogenic protein
MKRLCFAVAALVLACGSVANSADLRARRAAPSVFSPTPIMTWTGLYVGLNGGVGWGTTNHNLAGATTGDFDVSGGVFGGTIGYNFQMGPWVYGGEADLDWAHINGSRTGPFGFANFTSTLDWIDTVRVRIGYSFDPSSLLYFTGGAAYGSVTASAGGPLIGIPVALGQSDTRLGWTLGVGYERMFTPRWSGKLEYLYVDLGTNTQALADSVKFNTSIFRGGVNWRF